MVPGKDGEPFISDHLKQLRPFLAKGDFMPGGWGQALIDELAPADLSVEKVAFSAFYMSRLDWVLKQAGITDLICAGIVNNPDHISCQVCNVISTYFRRCIGIAVTSHVGSNDVIAGPGQHIHLVTPGIPRFRPAMRQDNQGIAGNTHFGDPHTQTVTLDYLHFHSCDSTAQNSIQWQPAMAFLIIDLHSVYWV